MSRSRDWCKLDARMRRNKKSRKLLRMFGPVVLGYMADVICRSYDESDHQHNPHGLFSCTLQDLADDLHDTHDRTAMWCAMVAVKFVRITGGEWREDLTSDVKIELVNFAKWQWPRGSSAKRSAEKREADDRAKSVEIAGKLNGTERNRTDTEHRREERREEENQYDKVVGTTATPTTNDAAAPFTEDVANANIVKARRKLSTLAEAVDDLAGMYATKNPVSVTRTRSSVWENVYRPVSLLLVEHGDAILRPAIAAALEQHIDRNPALWITRYCENVQADEILTGKPNGKHADDGRVYTVAAALAAYGVPAPAGDAA